MSQMYIWEGTINDKRYIQVLKQLLFCLFREDLVYFSNAKRPVASLSYQPIKTDEKNDNRK